ncbi:hypothetical protein [Entomohabitans teleogrylli]|uniref:hypothetical protein n=1 Tax=Entomohabitans teleogrylli TaxID=1384589 RepID=UPI00073D60C6|nr:hypothetical protein [Entomohabitans teleogrylli]
MTRDRFKLLIAYGFLALSSAILLSISVIILKSTGEILSDGCVPGQFSRVTGVGEDICITEHPLIYFLSVIARALMGLLPGVLSVVIILWLIGIPSRTGRRKNIRRRRQ